MLSNRLAFAALAIACIGAAAGGGYLATRQNTIPAPAAAQAQPSADVALAATPTAPAAGTRSAVPAAPAKTVQESEGVVAHTAARTPAAATKTASSKRTEPPARVVTRESRQPVATSARQDSVPALPSNFLGAAMPQPPAPQPPADVPQAPRPDDRAAQEPVRAPEPPRAAFEELVVSADSVIGLQTESRVSTETARVEDRIEAHVTRDVRVGGRVAIPAGTKAIGSVMQVERGGKFKERAKLGVRFHTLVLPDGTRIPIATETIYREGDTTGMSSPSKIGGATVVGAILGAIAGGSKGAAIGAAAGAGAGTAAVAAGDRNTATLAAGTPLTVRISQPITVSTENKN